MALFKNRRTGNVMNVTNEITIDIMRDSDQYEELDENGNPINPKPVVDPHEGVKAVFRNNQTGNILPVKNDDNIYFMRHSDQYEEITSE